ncbi:helix-turn-helix domain-containing protein [Photobacterium sanguinicancri]|uniref:AraC family transcriptional regulator n=1 Tax=Photobacterium sanguinicancri TaxID=875932 RepID=A0AAW7YCK1_9GAMM|nr:helix-turn-helix domain-containing protein [Photobacterium sanguinicancri]MDO6544578.1 helix-turn-helix domain-containing protein [Photobacterium sanguinicancri]OZS41578.1 AraC family transcriptional regulator [Photobacterium sanguinicancri]
MYTQHIKPTHQLSPFIAHFWLWEQNDTVKLPNMLPGTGVEILFNFGQPIIIQTAQQSHLNTNDCIVVCPRKSLIQFQPMGKTKILSIRFRSAGFFTLFGLPLTELSDQIIPMGQLLPTNLIEQLAETKSDIAKVTLLEQWLLQKQVSIAVQDSALQWAIDKIYYQNQSDSITEVKHQLKCSERTFQRKFKLFTGVDAKYFERTARFQSTLKALLTAQSTQYLAVAFDHGYYDQSHFIKDFKYYTQSTPSGYLTERNFSLNYYQTI